LRRLAARVRLRRPLPLGSVPIGFADWPAHRRLAAARAQADAQRFVRIAADAPMDSVRQAVLNALRERGLLAEELT
ncbi:MAG: hypothetical protein NT095_09130, partial [Burkholderiales bacterium]|nr:hypothetical protein [Burkholderiales bacterium]